MEQLPRLWDHWYALARSAELRQRALTRGLLDQEVTLTRAAGGVARAQVGLVSLPVCEQQGLVWVFPRAGTSPATEPLSLPLHGEPGVAGWSMAFEAEADLVDAIENALDAPHTHFVHAGLVRTEGRRQPVTATVRPLPGGVEVEYRNEPRQSGWFARLDLVRGQVTRLLVGERPEPAAERSLELML